MRCATGAVNLTASFGGPRATGIPAGTTAIIRNMNHCLQLALFLLVVGCASSDRVSLAHARGCWTLEQIDATDWPADVKSACRERVAAKGMTKEQVVAAMGKASRKTEADGVATWIYDGGTTVNWTDNRLDGFVVQFDKSGIVVSVTTTG